MKFRVWTLSIAATLLILIAGIIIFSKGYNNSLSQNNPINHEYYWSDDCKECQKVSEFLTLHESSLNKKGFKIDKYKVNDLENRRRFLERGGYCRISQEDLRLPFFISPNGICYTGDIIIIDYFKNLI